MRITRIENQRKRPGRKNIYADGKFIAGVSAETLIAMALRTGDELGQDQLKILLQTESLHGARNAALRYLSHRPRTEREIRQKLREKEFADTEIDRTIEDLRRSGLIDDREFARLFIRDSLSLRPVGKAVLKRKLLLLGVERTIVEEEVDEALRNTDQDATILALAERFVKKARAMKKNEPPAKLRTRLTAFLGRRGFAWDSIRSAVRTTLGNDE